MRRERERGRREERPKEEEEGLTSSLPSPLLFVPLTCVPLPAPGGPIRTARSIPSLLMARVRDQQTTDDRREEKKEGEENKREQGNLRMVAKLFIKWPTKFQTM
jgi:hypothetical protein